MSSLSASCAARILVIAAALAACGTASAQAWQTSSADSWLKEAAPNENHGNEKELFVKRKNGDSFRTVYQFDLSSVPAGANITRADVWLRAVAEPDEEDDPIEVYRMTDSWSENTVSWANSANDYDASTIWASFFPEEEGWNVVDMQSLFQAWVCQDYDNFGLILISTSNDDTASYTSKEWDNANRRPRLYLEYSGTTVCAGGSSVDHFVVVHDSWGIHCLNETITVRAEDVNGDPVTNYQDEVTLDTQTGSGTWTLVAGGGNFSDAAADDGLATYEWADGESEATFALSYPNGAPQFDIDVYQTSDPLIRDDDSEGNITFSPDGFTLTEAALPNPPPAVIAPFATPQIAGTDFAVHIAAYGQTPTDPVCGIIESYAGAKDLKFWSGYVDPVAGTITPTVDALGIAAAEAAAAPQSVNFVNGQATVTAKYKDVGRIQLSVKDDSQAHPDLPNGIRGATAAFVVKPAGFALTNIEDGAGNPNPGAADANGAAFIAAGDPFAATVTAYDAEGSVTPNYGQEVAAETVTLTPALVAPAGGDNPAIAAPLGFGAFVGGQATGSDFSWPEVGIITLTPSVGDGDYLGAGDVVGTTTGNVGRFFAHHFATALNVPTLATGCAAGTFTYIGDAFGYANVPVVTFTAEAAGGELTENYTGGFFKVDNASLPDRVYASVPATLDTSGLPAPAVDPSVADLGAGVGTLTFSSGGGLSFTRGVEEPAFNADIQLSQSLIDSDGAAASVNPVVFGDPGGMLWTAGAELRYGRGVVLNAYGSELVDLAVPFRTEYYVDAATGFVPNVDDACTNAVSLTLGAFTENLSPGDTCVYDSGQPGASGEGCPAAGPPALRWREPPLGGDFNLHLKAPNAGNDGSTTATADVPAWLEYDWNQSLPGLEDPSGTAVFGIYKGSERRIYIREVY